MSSGQGDIDAAYSALRWKHLRTVESMQTLLERNIELEKTVVNLEEKQAMSQKQHKQVLRIFARASKRSISLLRKEIEEERRAVASISSQEHAKLVEDVQLLAGISRALLGRSEGLEAEARDARALVLKLQNDIANGVGMEGRITSLTAELEAERMLRTSLQTTIDQMESQNNDAAGKLKALKEKFQRKLEEKEEAHNEEVSDLKNAYLNERNIFCGERDELMQIIAERENQIKYLLAEMEKLRSFQSSGAQFAKFIELKNQNAYLQTQVAELSKQLQLKDKKGASRRSRNSDDGGGASRLVAGSGAAAEGQVPRLHSQAPPQQQRQQQQQTPASKRPEMGGSSASSSSSFSSASGQAQIASASGLIAGASFRSGSVSQSDEFVEARLSQRGVFPSLSGDPIVYDEGIGLTVGLSDAPTIVARVGDIYNAISEDRYAQHMTRKKVFEPSISPVVSSVKLTELPGHDDLGSGSGRSSRRQEVLRMSDSESDFALEDAPPASGGDRGMLVPSGALPGPHPPALPIQQAVASVTAPKTRMEPVKISPRGPSHARKGIDNSSVSRAPQLIITGADAPVAAGMSKRNVSPLTGSVAAPSPRLRFSSR